MTRKIKSDSVESQAGKVSPAKCRNNYWLVAILVAAASALIIALSGIEADRSVKDPTAPCRSDESLLNYILNSDISYQDKVNIAEKAGKLGNLCGFIWIIDSERALAMGHPETVESVPGWAFNDEYTGTDAFSQISNSDTLEADSRLFEAMRYLNNADLFALLGMHRNLFDPSDRAILERQSRDFSRQGRLTAEMQLHSSLPESDRTDLLECYKSLERRAHRDLMNKICSNYSRNVPPGHQPFD